MISLVDKVEALNGVKLLILLSIYLTVGLTGSVCIVNNRQRPATEAGRFRQDSLRKGKYFEKNFHPPGKMKIKKALIPPMTLMTLLMSGTNMAVSTVTLIQTTVRMTLQRLSKE